MRALFPLSFPFNFGGVVTEEYEAPLVIYPNGV